MGIDILQGNVIMSEQSATELFSPRQVADLLGLHVRTVRRYVREGRLPARRIGKQYRIAREDLEAFTGGELADSALGPSHRQRYVEVSSVVQIEALDPDTAMRITTGLTATAQGRPPDERAPLKIESIYDETRARLKIIVSGDLDTTNYLLKLIERYLEP